MKSLVKDFEKNWFLVILSFVLGVISTIVFINPLRGLANSANWDSVLGIVETILALLSIIALVVIYFEIKGFQQDERQFFAEGVLAIRNLLNEKCSHQIEKGTGEIQTAGTNIADGNNSDNIRQGFDLATQSLRSIENELMFVMSFVTTYQISMDKFCTLFKDSICPIAEFQHFLNETKFRPLFSQKELETFFNGAWAHCQNKQLHSNCFDQMKVMFQYLEGNKM